MGFEGDKSAWRTTLRSWLTDGSFHQDKRGRSQGLHPIGGLEGLANSNELEGLAQPPLDVFAWRKL